jgi:hypothetical protein
VTLSGHINDSQWQDVVNTTLSFYISKVRYAYSTLSGTLVSSNASWWNVSWPYRLPVAVENNAALHLTTL